MAGADYHALVHHTTRPPAGVSGGARRLVIGFHFLMEGTMAKVSLSRMNVESLMELRDQVDQRLREYRVEMQKRLERMDRAIAAVGGQRVARGSGSALRGRKVPPKYRGRSGETWAGRGARPRWLVAAIKGGKKLDDFLIGKSARKGRKRRSK
jgi:DNA-binding protein H-NS